MYIEIFIKFETYKGEEEIAESWRCISPGIKKELIACLFVKPMPLTCLIHSHVFYSQGTCRYTCDVHPVDKNRSTYLIGLETKDMQYFT